MIKPHSHPPPGAAVRIDQSAPPARRDTPAALTKLAALVAAPIARHPVNELLPGAWGRRHQLRLADALYVELAGTIVALETNRVI